MRVGTFGEDGVECTFSTRDSLDGPWIFKNPDSEVILTTLIGRFMDCHAGKLQSDLEEKYIKPKWNTFKDGEQRYCELTIENDFEIISIEKNFKFNKIIFGIGSRFSWKALDGFHRVIGEFALSELQQSGVLLTIVQKKDEGVVRLNVST